MEAISKLSSKCESFEITSMDNSVLTGSPIYNRELYRRCRNQFVSNMEIAPCNAEASMRLATDLHVEPVAWNDRPQELRLVYRHEEA